MGSIPVVEVFPSGPGLEKAFSLLPVLVVWDLLEVGEWDGRLESFYTPAKHTIHVHVHVHFHV